MSTCPLHPEQERPCYLCGVARVRAAMTGARLWRNPETEDPVRARAIERARADRSKP